MRRSRASRHCRRSGPRLPASAGGPRSSAPPPTSEPILCPWQTDPSTGFACANTLLGSLFNVIWGSRAPVVSEPLLQGTSWTGVGGAYRDVTSSNQYLGMQTVKVPAFPQGVLAAADPLADLPGRGAAQLRSQLLELVDRQAAMTREVAKLVVFLPQFETALRPLTPAIRRLESVLGIGQARGPAAVAAVFAEKANALRQFKATVDGLIMRLRRLDPPRVSKPTYRAQLRSLRGMSASAGALAAALGTGSGAGAGSLLAAFDRAATSSQSARVQTGADRRDQGLRFADRPVDRPRPPGGADALAACPRPWADPRYRGRKCLHARQKGDIPIAFWYIASLTRLPDETRISMEPASLDSRQTKTGTLENPEVLENVPGHVIPILEREFDDFDTESTRYLKGDVEEDTFIKFRLKQGVYGQRQADVQMVRVKLPLGGVTPDQLDAFADGIEKYVPLRKGHITTRQNIQMHHIPLPDAAQLIRDLGDAGLSSREGCGNTMRNVTGDPRAGVLPGEEFDITPYAGRLRALLRPPSDHPGDAAQGQDRVRIAPPGTTRSPRSTTWRSSRRVRDGVRGVAVLVGGGTSIMPRLAPELYDFVELDNGDYLKVTEACMRIFDRQDWLRVNRARARIKVLVDKIGIDEFRTLVEEELQGDWVAERDFSLERILLRARRGGGRPGAPRRLRHAQRRPARLRSLRLDQRRRSAPGGLLDRRGQGPPRRSEPRPAPRPRRDHARVLRRLRSHHGPSEPGPALGPRRGSLRGVDAARGARPRRRRRRRDHRCRQLPRHRLVQARHHQLDGAQPGDPGPPGADEAERRAHPADPHQDERLPQWLRPASHRQHRLLRGLDQGRRAHDPGLHPAHRRAPTRAATSSSGSG